MALKVGVVGIRGIGNRHADCHMEDELAELVAVCDIVPSRADEAAEKHGVKAYYSLKDMLANEELDIVDVCTGGPENGGWHYEPAMEAIAAGRNVLVEKPISNDIEDAREMVAFAQEQNVYLGCNLNHYFTEPAEKAREAMNAGEIGEQVFCLHRMGFPGGERTFSAGGGPPNAKGFPYFHVKAFLAHPFSIMRYFCGDITHIQAFMSQPSFRKAAGDPMVSINSIHVQFQNGAVGYLFSQRGDATMGMGGWWSVEVGGTKGTFCIENCVEKYTFYPCPGTEGAAKPEKLGVGAAPPPTVHNTGVTDFGETFPRRIHAYLEDVTNKVPKHELRASGRDALATLEYTFAAIESFEAGGVLVRPNPLPIIKHIPAEREC
jgi:predicted dehydrogenase